MKVAGLDPGCTGGMATIGPNGIVTEMMPVIDKEIDLKTLKEWMVLHLDDADMVYLERVHAIFGSAAGATFKFGRVFGVLEGMLAALNVPYTLVSPKVWQAVVHQGTSGDKAKDRSHQAVTRLFPTVDLRPTVKCKNIHEGMMDALLIAEYGRRKYQGAE